MKRKIIGIMTALMCLTLFACFACSPPKENEQTETDTCYVTIEETDGGNIDVGGKYILTKGDSLTVKLVPESGYKAEKAVYKDSAANHEINASQLTDNTFTIHNIVSDIALSAVFVKDEPPVETEIFSIDTVVLPDRAGNINGSVSVDKNSVESGQTVVLTLKPNIDYRVGSVKVSKPDGSDFYNLDVSEVTLGGDLTVTVNGDILISVTFTAVSFYDVSLSVSGEGTVTPSASQVLPGGSLDIAVAAAEHYELTSFLVNGEEKIDEFTAGTLALRDIHYDVKIECVFSLEKHKVTVLPSENGTAYAESEYVEYGGEAKIYFTPDKGYVPYSLTYGDKTVSIDLTGFVTITVTQDTTVSLVFRPEKSEITLFGSVKTYGENMPVSELNLKISDINTGEIAAVVTTDAQGEYSVQLPKGIYDVTAQTQGYYDCNVRVVLNYDDVEKNIVVQRPSFEFDGGALNGLFDDGEKIVASGAADGYVVKNNFVSPYAVAEGKLSVSSDSADGAGFYASNGKVSAAVIYGSDGVYVYRNGVLIEKIDVTGLDSDGGFKIIKYDDYICVYYPSGQNGALSRYDVRVEGLAGDCEYGLAVKSSSADFAAEFSAVNIYADYAYIESMLFTKVSVTRNAFGTVQLEGFGSEKVSTLKDLTILAHPLDGYVLDYVTLNGNPLEPDEEAGGEYIFVFKPDDGFSVNEIEIHFVADTQQNENNLGTVTDGLGAGTSYDTSLFYRNDLEIDGADPGVIYVSTEEDAVYGGWFYMAVTGGGGSSAYPLYRSRDLSAWEKCGAADGNALEITSSSWSESTYWAPELMRDPVSGKYFIYFSARSKIGNSGTDYIASTANSYDRLYLGIGISDTPVGPYRMVTAERYYGAGVTSNRNGEALNESTPPINFGKHFADQLAGQGSKFVDSVTGMGIWPAIDISPFFTESGDFYIYFSQHVSSANSGNHIWALKMKDMVTPDWNTLTKIASPNYHRYTGKMGSILEKDWTGVRIDNDAGGSFDGNINEGTFVIEHDGMFYLTYSPFGYGSRRYSIMQAVGDTPMGPFTKLPRSNGNPVIGIGFESSMYDFMAGAGHHSFVKAGDEIFAVYHAFYNPLDNNENGSFMGRAIAIDRVQFVDSPYYDFDILQGNGPTYSLQPLPEVASGYGNIASEASVSATSVTSGTLKYLTDYRFVYQPYDKNMEFEATGDSVITMEFAQPRQIRAVMVYSSYTYDYALEMVDKITLTMADGSQQVLSGLTADENSVNRSKCVMRPGGSVIADFLPVNVKKIEISVKQDDKYNPSVDKIRIGDIVVLGKTGETSSDSPAYKNANGSQPDGYLLIDGVTSEPEVIGKNKYSYLADDVKIEASTVFTENGVYFFARAYDDKISWTAKNKFTKNTHFRLYFEDKNGGYKQIYIDAYNHKLFNNKITSGASVTGKINSKNTVSFTAEAFVSWQELGYSSAITRVRILPAYYRVENAGEGVSGKLILPPSVASVSAVSSYPTFTANGYQSMGAGEIFGDSLCGDFMTEGVTVKGTGVETDANGRREVFYTPGYSDNFVFEISAAASQGATGGFVLSFADGTRMDVPFTSFSGSKVFSLYKAGSLIMLVSDGNILYAVSEQDKFNQDYSGACAIGLYSDGSAIRFADAEYKVYKNAQDVTKESPAGTSGNYLPAVSVTGKGYVCIPSPIPQDGNTATIYLYPKDGYVFDSLKVNGVTVQVTDPSSGYPVAVRNTASLIQASFRKIENSFVLSGNVLSSPDGAPCGGAMLTFREKGTYNVYRLKTDDEGFYSIVLSQTAEYEVSVEKEGYPVAEYDYAKGEKEPEFSLKHYAIGESVDLNGQVIYSDLSVWDTSRRDENIYTASQNRTAYFTEGVGNNAVIMFKVTNKTDVGDYTTDGELTAAGIEYDPAIGIIVNNGTNSSFIGFWSSGYRVLIDNSAWAPKNENNLTDEYDNRTFAALNRTYSYMLIRQDNNYRLYYYSEKSGDYVKIYDSKEKGHDFSLTEGEAAFGFGFTSSKTFSIEFSDMEILLDEAAIPVMQQYT